MDITQIAVLAISVIGLLILLAILYIEGQRRD